MGELFSALIGLFGPAALEAANKQLRRILVGDDSFLRDPVLAALDRAAAEFQSHRPEREGASYHAVAFREANLERVLDSLFLGRPPLTTNDLSLEHLAEYEEEDLSQFCRMVETELRKDRQLDMLLETKRHHEQQDALVASVRNIEGMLDSFGTSLAMGRGSGREAGVERIHGGGVHTEPGEETDIWEVGGTTYSRGADHLLSYSWKTPELMAVRIEWNDGSRLYAEVDLEGNARTFEPRYGIDVYHLVFDRGQVTAKQDVPLPGGGRSLTYTLRDGRTVKAIVDEQGALVRLEGSRVQFDAATCTVRFVG